MNFSCTEDRRGHGRTGGQVPVPSVTESTVLALLRWIDSEQAMDPHCRSLHTEVGVSFFSSLVSQFSVELIFFLQIFTRGISREKPGVKYSKRTEVYYIYIAQAQRKFLSYIKLDSARY